MNCNTCGACCVEISISSPIPGMPQGKPAGVVCVNLVDNLCAIFGQPDRPKVCSSFQADPEICGSKYEEAVQRIRWFEFQTEPRH